ncbi:hypothetical protein GF380_03825 [Candidatus Uhrbacteria bacterium]|nr:hypothetical protein [Candidatus Uhrbacteria bacterium]MBD3284222.1 hypothetical protein [Candidatus Uhrbacteria bacterium]
MNVFTVGEQQDAHVELAREIVQECLQGVTHRARILEVFQKMHLMNIFQYGITPERLFVCIREQVVVDARECVASCREDADQPVELIALVHDIEEYQLQPIELTTSYAFLATRVYQAADVLLCRCRSADQLDPHAEQLELLLEPHPCCEKATPEALGMTKKDRAMLFGASIVRTVRFLECCRRLPHPIAIKNLKREFERHGHHPDDFAMTPAEQDRFL